MKINAKIGFDHKELKEGGEGGTIGSLTNVHTVVINSFVKIS